MNVTIGCIILAAGHSRRFKENKLLADFFGKPMVSWIMEALPVELREETHVVTRYDAVADLAKKHGLKIVKHDLPDQSDTIRLGLEKSEHWDGCLFIPGDMPYLKTATIRRMLSAFDEHKADIIRAGIHGKGRSPVLFPKSCFDELKALTGDTGGREILKHTALPIHIVDVEEERELTDFDYQEEVRHVYH